MTAWIYIGVAITSFLLGSYTNHKAAQLRRRAINRRIITQFRG